MSEMRREIPPKTGLPPDGWCMKPEFTPLNCSWCQSPCINYGELVLCVDCDDVERKPWWSE